MNRRGSPRNGTSGQRGRFRTRSILRRDRDERTKRSLVGFPRELFPPVNPACLVFPGQILVVENYRDADEAVSVLLEDLAEPLGYNLLGFDTEWKPNFGNGEDPPIALVQLASRNTCVLFCLLRMGRMPDCLRSVLTDDSICKVGHTVDNNDAAKLLNQHGLVLQNVVDLKEIASNLDIRPLGLRALCNTILSKDLDKTMAVSDWASEQLTPEQILYAASDAWVTREVYLRLAPPSMTPLRAEFDCTVCGKALLSKSALIHHLKDKQHFDRTITNGMHAAVRSGLRVPTGHNNGFYANGAAALGSSYPAGYSSFVAPSAGALYTGLPSAHATTQGLHANGLSSAPNSPKSKQQPLADSRASSDSSDSSVSSTGSVSVPAAAASEADPRIPCRVCGRDFTTEKALSQHVRAKGHGDERQNCIPSRSSDSQSDDDQASESVSEYSDDGDDDNVAVEEEQHTCGEPLGSPPALAQHVLEQSHVGESLPVGAAEQDGSTDEADSADYDDSASDEYTDETEIECDVCGRVFVGDDEFEQHVCSDEDEDDDSDAAGSADESVDASCSSEGDASESDLVACVVCNAEFASHHALTQHVRLTEHYSDPPENGDGDIIVVCAVCGAQFNDTGSLNDHVRGLGHFSGHESPRDSAQSDEQEGQEDQEEQESQEEDGVEEDDDDDEEEEGQEEQDGQEEHDDEVESEYSDDRNEGSRFTDDEPSKDDGASPSAAAS
eukprot:TRINITY_DN2077_c0_g1_i2.p1 TRINITY_DN2077_c0_g1~~TRINITY_DN2077_c0_g1_i2.p1  ORF type:complete len:725 (-),score=189.58 TRINITY_DN2077_c0_g1_i2:474-2648(-)